MKQRPIPTRGVTAAVAAATAAFAFAPTAGAQGPGALSPGATAKQRASKACSGSTTQESERVLDQEAVYSTEIFIDENCEVQTSTLVSRSNGRNPVRTEAGAAGGSQALLVNYGNIIQSSQTLQDIINIDISKFRYGHDRVWNGAQTYMKSGVRWKTADAGPSWNHVTGSYFDLQETAWAASARGIAHGDFHSDFLWCNLQPGQNFTLKTTLTSHSDGGRSVAFTQSQTCSGTHMATAHKTSVVPGAWS